jgi:hypothetical protein
VRQSLEAEQLLPGSVRGQHVKPAFVPSSGWNKSASAARVAMFSSITAVGAVVYPDSDMIQLFTTDGEDDLVVKRSSAVDVAAPWTSGEREAEART